MAAQASLAEYYREHREAFLLALELGCTPRKAKTILRDRARARRRACGTRAPEPALRQAQGERMEIEPMDRAPADFSEWRASWMMRD